MSSGGAEDPRWDTTRERGAPFMLRLLIRCALLLGRRGVRPIIYVTVAYFIATSPTGRRSSRNFLRRTLQREPDLRDVWRHFFAFAVCSVDRIFILAGRHQEVEVTVRGIPVELLSKSSGGCLFITAHLGSFEVLKLVGDRRDRPFSVLLDKELGKKFVSLLEQLNPKMTASIIDASRRGPELVLSIKEALQNNQRIGMTADRIRQGERSVPIEFLGQPAQFPLSPWILAGALRVPIFLGFGVYRGGNRYDVHFELFAERLELPRAEREAHLQRYAQQFASRLEHYARLAPYNWFNFYDFWA